MSIEENDTAKMNDFLLPPTEKHTEVLETPQNFTHSRSGLSVSETIDSKSVHPSEISFIPRQALQVSISRHRSSLTGKELSFLQDLVVDGAEEELTKAIHVLADDSVFFEADDIGTQIRQNRPEGKDWDACVGAVDSYINSSMLSDLHETIDFEGKSIQFDRTFHERPIPSHDLCNSFKAVEITSGEDGAVELQDNTTQFYKGILVDDECVPALVKEEVEEVQEEECYLPIPLCGYGSEARMARVLERKESRVHDSLWRAHESGITLTPNVPINATHSNGTSRRSTSFQRRFSTQTSIQAGAVGKLALAPSCAIPSAKEAFASLPMNRSDASIRQGFFCRPSVRSSDPVADSSLSSIPGLDLAQPMDDSFGSLTSDLTRFTQITRPLSSSTMFSFQSGLNTQDVVSDDGSFRSIPALDLAKPIRQASINSSHAEQLSFRGSMTSMSYLSLNLARPIRRDSFLSGDSAKHVRRGSITSIDTYDSENLFPWEPYDSIRSFASLRPANHIRHESINSIDSVSAQHHDFPRFRESSASIETFAPLRPANLIKSESTSSIGKIAPLYPVKSNGQDPISRNNTLVSRPEKIMRQHSNGSTHSLIPPLRPGNPIRRASLGSQSVIASSLRRSSLSRQESSGPINTTLSRRPSLIRHNSSGSLRSVNRNSSISSNNSLYGIGYPIRRRNSSNSNESARSSRHRHILRSISPSRVSLRCRSATDSTTSSQKCAVRYVEDAIKEETSKSFSSDASPTDSERFGNLKTIFSEESGADCQLISKDEDIFIGALKSSSADPVWSAPSPCLAKEESKNTLPVLIQKADDGVGLEVANVDNEQAAEAIARMETIESARRHKSIMSVSAMDDSCISLVSLSTENHNELVNAVPLRRSYSDQDISVSTWVKENCERNREELESGLQIIVVGAHDDEKSWDLNSCDASFDNPGDWDAFYDEYLEHRDGVRGLPFLILGTSRDDKAAQPHVLSPPLMESLSCFLPYAVGEENWWMKYSLVRDGASLLTLMMHIRASDRTFIAIETLDGEVFGSFTSTQWRKSPNFFGNGESFLWRLKEPRTLSTRSMSAIDLASLESDIEVFPWTGRDRLIQYCTGDRIAIGGNTGNERVNDVKTESGFGLVIEKNLLRGTSSFSSTFNSPPLTRIRQDSFFEIVNIEVWTLTPCIDVQEAEKIEFGRLFLELNTAQ